MRRSETIRRLERYIHERGLLDGQRTVNQLAWPSESRSTPSRA
jgi:hypothetical protein